MRERLLGLIPEFNLIEDADLREKCLKTYELAMQEGGWTPDDLTRIPFTLLLNPCPASYIEHVRAVTLCAVRAAEVFREVYNDRLPVRMDILVAGALLHDVGKLVEYENRPDGMTVPTYNGKLIRHPVSGMELAARCGLPVDVLHIIVAHSAEGDKVNRTTEATLVNHADFMSFHSFQRLMTKKESAARVG